MIRTWRMIRGNWRKLYRHHGALAAARCLRGSWKLTHGQFDAGGAPATVDIVTFSVVPALTALWTRLIERAIPTGSRRILIGDCSGGLHRWLSAQGDRKIVPLLNHHHGEKLDLFVEKLCRAEYLVISDDDIFWLDRTPWVWAHDQLENDPQVAVVSLVPRDQASSVLQGKVDQPMGSHCLVLRRRLWLEQGLSFQIMQPPATAGYDWFYDTADFAQVELLRRGYRVVIAPPAVRCHLAKFEAVSAWILKLQKHSERGLVAAIAGIPLRQEKALRAVLVARGLATLTRDLGRGAPAEVVNPGLLERAERKLREWMERDQVEQIESSVDAVLAQVRAALQEDFRCGAPAASAPSGVPALKEMP